jgi:hypothetical protein
MKLEEFREEYSGSPIDLEEMANTIQNDLEREGNAISFNLLSGSRRLIQAIDDFREFLKDADIELG